MTVGTDETAETIGRRYGVPASAIMQANGLQKATDIRPGQRLVIPRYISAATPQPAPVASKPAPVAVAKPAQPAPPKESVYKVASGDTLIGIARKYNVALPELAKANNVEPNHRVAPGDRIMVPGRPQHRAAASQHAEDREAADRAAADGREHPAAARQRCDARADCAGNGRQDRGACRCDADLPLAGAWPRDFLVRRPRQRSAQ